MGKVKTLFEPGKQKSEAKEEVDVWKSIVTTGKLPPEVIRSREAQEAFLMVYPDIADRQDFLKTLPQTLEYLKEILSSQDPSDKLKALQQLIVDTLGPDINAHTVNQGAEPAANTL